MSNQAAWLDGPGKTFRVADADMPKAAADHVVIRNKALAINPVDWKVQASGYFIKDDSWPVVLGCDVAGEIVEVGSDVKGLKVGDRVAAHMISLVSQVQKDGGFQLYSSAPAAITAVLPTSTTYNQGAVLPLAVDTAATGLYDSADKGCLALDYPSLSPKPSGKTIVVWGGSSSVGALATQLATASGAKVVAVASEHNFDFCKKCGASEVVSYKSSDVVEEVRSAVKKVGGTFVGVYDAISTQDDSYKFTIPILEALGGGNLATVLPGPEKVPSSVKTGAVFAINPVTHALWKDYVTPALEQGKLLCLPEPMVVGKGLESVQKGCDTNKKGVSAKKVVIEL